MVYVLEDVNSHCLPSESTPWGTPPRCGRKRPCWRFCLRVTFFHCFPQGNWNRNLLLDCRLSQCSCTISTLFKKRHDRMLGFRMRKNDNSLKTPEAVETTGMSTMPQSLYSSDSTDECWSICSNCSNGDNHHSEMERRRLWLGPYRSTRWRELLCRFPSFPFLEWVILWMWTGRKG